MKPVITPLLLVAVMIPLVGFAQSANTASQNTNQSTTTATAETTAQSATTTATADTATPATTDTDKSDSATATAEQTTDATPPAPPPPESPHDPNAPTLAQLAQPDDSELSKANVALLAKNNELQSRIDELTTEVNVLVNERGGQLFLYGAISTFVSFVVGFLLALLVLRGKSK